MDEQSEDFLKSGPMSQAADGQKFGRQERRDELPRSEPYPNHLPNLSLLADRGPWATSSDKPWLLLDGKGRRIATFDSITEDGDTRGGINFVNAEFTAGCVELVRGLADTLDVPVESLEDVILERFGRSSITLGVKPNLREMQHAVIAWAQAALPNRTAASTMLKFAEEAGELIQDPRAAKEYADVMVCLLDLADRFGVDMVGQFWARMAELRASAWELDSKTGVARRA